MSDIAAVAIIYLVLAFYFKHLFYWAKFKLIEFYLLDLLFQTWACVHSLFPSPGKQSY